MAVASNSHPGLSERVRKLINAANARMEAGVAICTILHLPNIALQDGMQHARERMLCGVQQLGFPTFRHDSETIELRS